MIVKAIIVHGRPAALACDARCDKSWGIDLRQRVQLSADEDDYEWLADDELGTAPNDPGSVEDCDAKPVEPQDRLNKWCGRQCERSAWTVLGEKYVCLPDFSKRVRNIPAVTERQR